MSDHPEHVTDAQATERATRPKAVDRHARVTAYVSVIVGFAGLILAGWSFYHQNVKVTHDLSLMCANFQYARAESIMSVTLVFTNDGNQDELVMGANLFLPIPGQSGEHWLTHIDRISIAPFTIKAGNVVQKCLTQPASDELLLAHQDRSNKNAFQEVGLRVVVRSPEFGPQTHKMKLGRTPLDTIMVSRWEVFSASPLDRSPQPGVIYKDLLPETNVGWEKIPESFTAVAGICE